MIRVRRHERQLASGKVTTVRQHQRQVDISAGQGGLRERPEDEWWDNPEGAEMAREGDPEGTFYFREASGAAMAMYPDGTVHEVEESEPAGEEADGFAYAVVTPSGYRYLTADQDEALRQAATWSDEDSQGHAYPVEHLPGDGTARTVGSYRRGEPESRTLISMKQGMREWRARDVPLLPPEPMTPQMEKLMGCDTPEGREKYERGRAYREAGYDGPLGPDDRIPDPDDPAEAESLSALAYMRWQEENR
jgi:hypothetical protein